MRTQVKKIIYEILEISTSTNLYSLADDIIIQSLIVLNITAFIASTSADLSATYHQTFENIEIVSSLVFSLEYILRMWVCTVDTKYSHPIWGRIKYALTPLSLIDLFSILPFYLLLLFPNLSFVYLISLLRLLRLIKISRYSESVRTLGTVLYAKKEELLATAFAVFILLVFASSLMYFVESSAQPKSFGSIPDAMWWGVVTLTTVGYGDIYPITPIGRFLGSMLAFLGIGIFALPAGIISSGFSEEVQRRKEQKNTDNLQQSTDYQSVEIFAESEVSFQQKQQVIALHVEKSSELMKLCVDRTKQNLDTAFESEEIIRDLAIHLYNEARRKFDI
ncbi:ion transporter [Tychonema sp. BBK16]|uniref:ion transporter n=1 Tax=Tychonema sp. BBK16 TaxID=2699888 RepID=UPI001F1EB188|nr:ion transporter [Tychonema sp. BBK16]MCF6373789.1 ion transporter [Tychonema sp. BBK16]